MAKQPVVVEPGTQVNLADFDPRFKGDFNKSSANEVLKSLQKKMRALQRRLYAEGEQSLLIVLQAMDAGGKDSTIRHVFHGVNPQGVHVASFKKPTEKELAYDFLWRVHPHVPRKGQISIFNRSHYEDVLVVRVNNLVPEATWRSRYEHINNFEKLLADNGTRIIKFFLQISREEQKERFQDRLDDPEKHWKFSKWDLPVRAQWDDYMRAFEDAITACNTEYAPWYIIPADRKWYRNLVVTQAIVETLEAMNPQFPPPEDGLDQINIPE
jgi:PPK2 family polyphosphate:nucleotide phosphotransferase